MHEVRMERLLVGCECLRAHTHTHTHTHTLAYQMQ
jgi:hypothetical protein